MNLLIGCIAGVLFGTGLVVAQMTDPNRVLGFLDLTQWDPRLGFVMVGAIAVHAPCVLWLRLRTKSAMLQQRLALPQGRVDGRLVIGSAIFGIGWGLAGYCPGPALTSAATSLPALLLTLAMFAGMLLHDRIMYRTRTQAANPEDGYEPENLQQRQGVLG